MNASQNERYSHPLWELIVVRLKEFHRTPHAIFWVYGFPLIMASALGIAFQNRPIEKIRVDIQDHGPEELRDALATNKRLEVKEVAATDTHRRLTRAQTDVVVVPGDPP